MKRLLLCAFIILNLTGNLFAYFSPEQDSLHFDIPDSIFVVDSIHFLGNDDTRDFVIQREMSLKPNALITKSLIEYDKKRIYSLGLFNRVEIEITPTRENKADITVIVNERWFIYPYPIFGLKDRDWSKLFYGVGLSHINFRGRNEKVYFSLALGYDPWISLSYRNPFLDNEGDYSLEGRISYNKVRNKSKEAETLRGEFDEHHFNAGATIAKRFGIKHIVWSSFNYQLVSIPENTNAGMNFPEEKQSYPQLTLGYSFDTRDLHEYPSFGTLFGATISHYGIGAEDVDFNKFSIEYQKFIPLDTRWVAAFRIFSTVSAGGAIPAYEHVYFGYGDRLRGHFKEVMEGENLIGASTELHFTLLEPRYIEVKFLPKEFGLWKFGMTAALFGDVGRVWYGGEKIDVNSFPGGYGGGIHFILPYSIVIRTEYGWNELGKGQFILDFGSSF